jgi:preprotein translocase subunit SecF
MGQQLRNDGIKSVLYALLLMLVYIGLALRLPLRAGRRCRAWPTTCSSPWGIFAITWTWSSTLPVVAALLTISRATRSTTPSSSTTESARTRRALRDRKFPLVVNASINETLSRTVADLAHHALHHRGDLGHGNGRPRDLRDRAHHRVCIVGTYSSVFVASPLVVLLNERFAAAKRKTGRAR